MEEAAPSLKIPGYGLCMDVLYLLTSPGEQGTGSGEVFIGNASLRLIITGSLPKSVVLQHCWYRLNQNACLEGQCCLPNATCGKANLSTKQNVFCTQAVGCCHCWE